MQYAIGLHMAPIHRHFRADEIRSYFQNTDAKGARQAIGEPGFNGGRRGGAFPDGHGVVAFKIASERKDSDS